MNLIKQDIYIESLEEGKFWTEYPDDTENGFWLKPIKQVYVLTEDELINLIDDFSIMELSDPVLDGKDFLNITQSTQK